MQDIEPLTDCAKFHFHHYNKLSEKQKQALQELPCECEKAALSELISDYTCESCDTTYYYSFCMQQVVESHDFWHCGPCGTCRESAEWHCKKCEDCSYGLSLSCDGCGKKSPYSG